jgi:hypothetical protein
MSEETFDSYEYTPERLIRRVLETDLPTYKDNPPSKAVVIFLWDEPEGNYDVTSFRAGLRSSELISLLEYAKFLELDRMNHPDAPEEE